MSAAIIAIIVVVAVVVLVFSAMAMTRRRLQQRFGPEYDRVVGEKHGQFRGAAELARRERRVQRLRIRPLTASARAEYTAEWRAVQESFVDQPLSAVTDGHELLVSAMKERGYPAEDPDQIAADLSVTHPHALDHYRAARQISVDAERGDGSTEDLRQALIHVRVVFGEMLGKPDDVEPTESAEAGPRESGVGQQVSRSRALEAEVPVGAGRAPGAAATNGAVSNGGAAADAARDGAVRDGAVRADRAPADRAPDGAPADAARDAAVRDAVAPADAARDAAVRDGGATDDAVAPEPEEQLWRPGIQVPPARTSAEETQ